MARVDEQLVGRAAELSSLDRAVAELRHRRAASLVVVGEPGIGKTRLLAGLQARADASGFNVLSGSASELEVDLPFWVFVDALDEYVAGLEPRRLQSLGGEARAELARVLPSQYEFAGAGPPALQDERYRAHRAMRELLQRLAAPKPLVLLLDDLHWADPASVELLEALLRGPPTAAVMLAMAARPRQLPERLEAALMRAQGAGSLTRVELGALARDEVRLLLGDAVDQRRLDTLYEESGGNPFYAEQLARTPRRVEGGEGLALGVDVPAAVAAALTDELGLLSAPTRTFLQGAAVAGDPFDPELAAAAAAADHTAAMQARDELLALDLVRTTGVPSRLRFRHPLVRRAVYEGASGGWRLGAHERCADALAARGASATARAHHVEHAARRGDMAGLAVMREAGEASAVRAPASAARWFGAALRLLPAGAPAEERVGLLLLRAQALAAVGRLEESRADLLESLALVPAELASLRVTLTVACAGVEHMLGRYEDAHARLTAALERLPDPGGPEAVTLMVVMAFDALFRTDFAAMGEAGSSALKRARALGDPGLTAMAAAVHALGSAFAGATTRAEAACAEAAGLLDDLSDEQLAQRIDAAAHLAAAEFFLDRYDAAAAHAERARTVARATGQHFPTLIPTLASVYAIRGRLAEAAEAIDGGLETARLANSAQDIGWALHIQSSIALAAGDREAALRAAEESAEITRGLSESFVSAFPGLALAAALLPAGEPARAVDVLPRLAGGPELPLIPGSWRAQGFEILASSHLQLGRRDDAERAVALAQARAAEVGLPTAVCWAQRAAAALALDAGQPAQAAKRAMASAAAAEGAGAVLEAALSRTLAGRAHAKAGDGDSAVAELEQAVAQLDACGAQRYRDAAERELRKLGRHIHRRTRRGTADGAGLELLSERELQVAHLVVDRKTNREIAGELFVSLKTVEAHMRNLFRKLDVSSRVEVARAVERAERAKR